MRFSKIMFALGWGIALAATAACFLLFDRLIETRAKERLTAIQLPAHADTVVTENWESVARRVMLVGDSRVRRWTPLPESAGIAFGKSGVGGETLGQLERRFEDNVLGFAPAPQELILATGVNDLVAASLYARWGEGFQSAVVTQIRTRLEGLIDQARARGLTVRLATIIQAAAPDLVRQQIFWDDSLFGLIEATNRQIEDLAREKGIDVIDFNALLDGGSGPLPAIYAADTLHFSPEAYTTLNAGLLAAYDAR
jgi:lysophospholipase L1-like esterase